MALLGDINFYIKIGDTTPSLVMLLEDAVTGLAVDLTGVDEIKLWLREPWSETLLVDGGVCSPVNPPGVDGLAKYTWQDATEIDTKGLWLGEVRVTDGLLVQRFPNDGYFRVAVLGNLEVV